MTICFPAPPSNSSLADDRHGDAVKLDVSQGLGICKWRYDHASETESTRGQQTVTGLVRRAPPAMIKSQY